MKKTVFLAVSQFLDNYDLNIQGMNIRDVVEYVITHDLMHAHDIEIRQSDTGETYANTGQIIYKADDKGVLSYYKDKVDSSD